MTDIIFIILYDTHLMETESVFPPFPSPNLPAISHPNLPAISHHKSSRHFSPQIFPPFLATNLPAILHHKSSCHFSPGQEETLACSVGGVVDDLPLSQCLVGWGACLPLVCDVRESLGSQDRCGCNGEEGCVRHWEISAEEFA